MKKLELAKNNMFKKVRNFLTEHLSLLIGFERLMQEITNFFNLDDQLNALIKVQSKSTKGITEDKTLSLKQLRLSFVNTARKMLVYAKDKKNTVLVNLLNVRDSDFRNLPYTVALASMKGIYESMAAVTDPLTNYRVTPDELLALDTGIQHCTTLQGGPGVAAGAKQVATASIKKLMQQADTSLVIIDDLIRSNLGQENSDFAEGYFVNRYLDLTGIRHTALDINTVDKATQAPLENVTASLQGTRKKAVSDINGNVQLTTVLHGTYHINFSATGYISQVNTITLEKGKITELRVEMVKE